MPYISVADYALAQNLIKQAKADNVALRAMEQDIYALNRLIRAIPDHPTPRAEELMAQHRRLLDAYHEAGGTRL